MEFYDLLDRILDVLRQRRRVTYSALKREFNLDDDYLEDLKEALFYAHPTVIDDEGRGMVWTGDPPSASAFGIRFRENPSTRLQVVLPAVLGLLQREGRVTYRTLTEIFACEAAFLDTLREELVFKQVARDENGKGLVWTGEAPSLQPQQTMPTASGREIPSKMLPEEPRLDESATPLDRSALEAERRQVTVMFCDLVDSTHLSQQLDPEDYRTVVQVYQETAANAIQLFDGYIAQYLGDGLMVYFGWPQAYEDAAHRAVYAGLAILDALGPLNENHLESQYGVRIAVRIGLHTGMAVIGEMGGGNRHESLAMGDTPNIASRIQGLADPDMIALSAATVRLLQGVFALDDLGTHTLKGVSEPMQAFRVLGPTAVHEGETVVASPPALVGRDEEIGLLMRRWEQSKEGLGQVVLIGGEAGIGKTALVEVLRAHVRGEGLPRIAFRCSPYHQNSALYPVLAHVEHFLQLERNDSADVKLHKLEQGLQTYSLPLDEIVPLFAALFSVPLPEGRYPARSLTPQQQKQQTLDALVTCLMEEAEHQPVLAVWENLHWADPSTLEMLNLVLEQTPTAPMLSVLTFRPEFHPPWSTRSHMTPISLNRLERPQVEALITQLAGGKPLPEEVAEHIVAKTDGVPLYAEELTKMLLESDVLQEDADAYVLTGPLLTVAIPDTLQDSLMARLDRLNTAKEVAQLGAVLGREFAYEMLQAVSSQDEELLQTGLAQLVEAELLYQRGRPPRAKYIFKHALIQDAAYTSLLKSTRQQLHEEIARLLEARFPEVVDTQPEVLAHHYAAADCSAQAIAYTVRAGEQSARLYANTEAITYYEQALTILDILPATDATHQQRVDLNLHIASLHILLGHYNDSLSFLDQALEGAETAEDIKTIAHVETRIGRVRYNMGDYEDAKTSFERALDLSQRIHDTTRMAICYQTLGYIYFSCGRLSQVIDCFTRALQISESVESRSGIAAACTYLSNAHTRAGNLAEAVQWGQRALEIGEQMQDDRRIAWACIMLAQAYVLRGDAAQAQTLLDRALPLCDTVGDFLAQAWVHIWCGDVLATGGQDFERALEHAQHVIRMGTESGGFQHEVSHQFARGAEYFMRLGRYQEAYDYCHQGLAISHPASNRLEYGYAYMVLAELHASELYRDWDKAAWYLEESHKAFREVEAQIDIGRAHLAGARIALQRQDGSARQWAETARDTFAERGATALRREAEMLIDKLGP